MEDNNRINRRSRPRPYDLRRKVLLKNFLREQMTFIPAVHIEPISQNDDVNSVEEPSLSIRLDEDLPELNDENSSSVAVVSEQCNSSSSDSIDSAPGVSDPKDNILESVKSTSSDVNTSSNVNNESSLYKLANLIKHKRDSKKKQKGVGKAKEVHKSVKSPTKSKSFKSGLERVFNRRKKPNESSPQTSKPKVPPRSLFTLFKHRKAQRNTTEVDRIKRSYVDHKSNGARTKYPTANQSVSVQTEDTWAREELFKVQQSNRLLREENRLLSESLSYFMSSSSMDPQINHCSSPLQSSNKNTFDSGYHDYFSSSSPNNWNPRARITRSKSVQEHNERRSILRNNYRTRSMNCHNVRNKFLLPDPKPHMSYNTQPVGYNIPRVRRKNILANLPVNSSVRGIQRRSSMPERNLSENDRSIICRRSESFRDTYCRKPFYSLPSEAFY